MSTPPPEPARTPDAPGAWWWWNFSTEEWTIGSVQYRGGKLVKVGRSVFDVPLDWTLWGGHASKPPVCSPTEAATLQKRDFAYETRLARGES